MPTLPTLIVWTTGVVSGNRFTSFRLAKFNRFHWINTAFDTLNVVADRLGLDAFGESNRFRRVTASLGFSLVFGG